MKCVVLCGGKGSRLVEMTDVIPKPMLPVGGRPLLQHILNIYRYHGVKEFILPVGHKKEHIIAYLLSNRPTDVVGKDGYQQFTYKDYQVTTLDTGEETQTGGRLRRIMGLLLGPFHFTYGDGLSDVNLDKLEKTFYAHPGNTATITLVHPEGRFGRAVVQEDGLITEFGEKAETSDWINGGFSILSAEIFKYIDDDDCNLEKDVYPVLAMNNKLMGYQHDGFWKCVEECKTFRFLKWMLLLERTHTMRLSETH